MEIQFQKRVFLYLSNSKYRAKCNKILYSLYRIGINSFFIYFLFILSILILFVQKKKDNLSEKDPIEYTKFKHLCRNLKNVTFNLYTCK